MALLQSAVQQARAALENPGLVGEPRQTAPSAGGNENLSPNPGFDMGMVRLVSGVQQAANCRRP